MQTISLSAEVREAQGTAVARRMRKDGNVPAVFYGPGRATMSITIGAKEFANTVGSAGGGSPLIQLSSSAKELRDRVVLLKDVQYDALSGVVTHADFLEVDMNTKLRVPVALHFVGKPVGVVRGGILQPIRRQVDVECLPGDIPEHIDVDVSGLEIHDSVHVSTLPLPEDVVVPYDTDFTLVTVAPPTVAEAAPSETALEEAEAAVEEETTATDTEEA